MEQSKREAEPGYLFGSVENEVAKDPLRVGCWRSAILMRRSALRHQMNFRKARIREAQQTRPMEMDDMHVHLQTSGGSSKQLNIPARPFVIFSKNSVNRPISS
jgi:hypothetical protein